MIFPRKTKIMAILNVTPDSFSDGGRLNSVDAALDAAEQALKTGADILDIGGESTRPGAVLIDADEEQRRVLPVIAAIQQRFPEAVISIDTRKAIVAKHAIEAGAQIINDVSGLQFDSAMAEIAAQTDAMLILMHSQGDPETMQQNPVYPQGVMEEVHRFFQRQIALAQQAGIQANRIIIDPGFGFGKTLAHNLLLLRNLDRLQTLGCPILVGTSRKSFLTLGDARITANRREELTAASIALAIQNGAEYVRIHNVAAQAPAIWLMDAVLNAE